MIASFALASLTVLIAVCNSSDFWPDMFGILSFDARVHTSRVGVPLLCVLKVYMYSRGLFLFLFGSRAGVAVNRVHTLQG